MPQGNKGRRGSRAKKGQVRVLGSGELLVEFWKLCLRATGLMLTIPFSDEEQEVVQHVYAGKYPREKLTVEKEAKWFRALVERARSLIVGKNDLESIKTLCHFVYELLGGRLTPSGIDKVEDFCRQHKGRVVSLQPFVEDLELGVCRHRAYLFRDVARAVGYDAALFRGRVPGGRHAWNWVRLGERTVFVDPMMDVVMEDAAEYEAQLGYDASRILDQRQLKPADQSVLLEIGDQVTRDKSIVLSEVRVSPDYDAAVLLIQPKREIPEADYFRLRMSADAIAGRFFDQPDSTAGRVYAVYEEGYAELEHEIRVPGAPPVPEVPQEPVVVPEVPQEPVVVPVLPPAPAPPPRRHHSRWARALPVLGVAAVLLGLWNGRDTEPAHSSSGKPDASQHRPDAGPRPLRITVRAPGGTCVLRHSGKRQRARVPCTFEVPAGLRLHLLVFRRGFRPVVRRWVPVADEVVWLEDWQRRPRATARLTLPRPDTLAPSADAAAPQQQLDPDAAPGADAELPEPEQAPEAQQGSETEESPEAQQGSETEESPEAQQVSEPEESSEPDARPAQPDPNAGADQVTLPADDPKLTH